MSDDFDARWRAKREAKAEANRKVMLEALGDMDAPLAIPNKGWLVHEEAIQQPVNPELYGTGILFAERFPLIDEAVILVIYTGDGDYARVSGYEPCDWDQVRGYQDKKWGIRPRDFYETSIHLPRDNWRDEKESDAEVSMTGGGTRDPIKVLAASRCLFIAATIANAFNV